MNDKISPAKTQEEDVNPPTKVTTGVDKNKILITGLESDDNKRSNGSNPISISVIVSEENLKSPNPPTPQKRLSAMNNKKTFSIKVTPPKKGNYVQYTNFVPLDNNIILLAVNGSQDNMILQSSC